MRHVFSVLVLLQGLAAGLNAQFYWGFGIGYGRGTHEDLRLSADFVLPSQFSFGANTQHLERTAPNLPADYREGFCIYDHCKPVVRMNVIALVAGRALALSPVFRLNLRGGLAVNFLEEPADFRPAAPDPFGLASNYVYDKNKYANAGLVLEPRLEFLPARTVGAALGGFAHINKTNPAYGVFVELLGGWRLREGRE